MPFSSKKKERAYFSNYYKDPAKLEKKRKRNREYMRRVRKLKAKNKK